MMFGLGSCMCHCNATLWKVDAATGELVWARDRGQNSFDLDWYDDGSDLYFYESGTGTVADDRAVTKWRDDGSNAEKIWEHSRGGSGTNNPLVYSWSDNTIWLGNKAFTDIRRISDVDGSLLTSAFPSGDAPSEFFDGPAGNIFARYPRRLSKIDNTIAIVASTVSDIFDVSLVVGRMPVGFIAGAETSEARLRTYDDDLATTGDVHAPDVVPTVGSREEFAIVERNPAGAKTIGIERDSGLPVTAERLHRIDIPALASDWDLAPYEPQPTYRDVAPVAIVDGTESYVLEIARSGTILDSARIIRLDDAGGILWSSIFLVGGTGFGGQSYSLHVSGGQLFVVNRSGVGPLLFHGGGSVVAMALDTSTGIVNWARGLEDAGRSIGKSHVVNGHLYFCGVRGTRDTQPDLAP